jgi:hypothetical protein
VTHSAIDELDDAIIDYVFLLNTDDGVTRASCFKAAVREARGLTRRDEHTGEHRDAAGDPCWSGALMYLVVLEQLGNVLRPKGATTQTGQAGVLEALRHFAPELPVDEREALYALRNAFAHEFGLTNGPPGAKNPNRWHAFALFPDGKGLVALPAVRWNGLYGDKSTPGRTEISLRALGDLVERIVEDVEDRAREKTLELTPNVLGGADELRDRFSFTFVNTDDEDELDEDLAGDWEPEHEQ